MVLERISPYEQIKIDYCKSLEIAKQGAMHKTFAEFTKRIHHEIKNPLYSLSLYTSGMERETANLNFEDKAALEIYKTRLQKYMSIAKVSIEQVNNVTKIMSKYCYVMDENKFKLNDQEIPKVKLNINQVIKKTFDLSEMASVEKGTTIKEEFTEGLPPFLGNEVQINQIVLNVVLNAFQAMQSGGSITIKTSLDKFISKNGITMDGIRVDISDTGAGMTKEQMERMFDPFYTTKYENPGLGLSIVFGIVDDHGGAINVSSEVGKGTTFTFFLPIYK